jgi:hypothetical protein
MLLLPGVAVGDPSASYIMIPSCVSPVSPQEILLPPRFRALSYSLPSSLSPSGANCLSMYMRDWSGIEALCATAASKSQQILLDLHCLMAYRPWLCVCPAWLRRNPV